MKLFPKMKMKLRVIPNKIKKYIGLDLTTDDLKSKAVKIASSNKELLDALELLLSRFKKSESLTKEQLIFLICYLKTDQGNSNVPANSTPYPDSIKNGRSELHMALRHCNPKAFKMLLDIGADPIVRFTFESTLLHLLMIPRTVPKKAIPWAEARVTDLLNAGADLDAAGYGGQTALHFAAKFRRKKLAKILLDAGADINAQDDFGDTPLFSAQVSVLFRHSKPKYLHKYGTIEGMVEFLINSGADVHKPGYKGFTVLHDAARFQNAKSVKLFLAAGANPNARNIDGFTPLLIASCLTAKGIVADLINAGADVNAMNNRGETALDFAIRHGRKKITKMLRANGAHPNAGADNSCNEQQREKQQRLLSPTSARLVGQIPLVAACGVSGAVVVH